MKFFNILLLLSCMTMTALNLSARAGDDAVGSNQILGEDGAGTQDLFGRPGHGRKPLMPGEQGHGRPPLGDQTKPMPGQDGEMHTLPYDETMPAPGSDPSTWSPYPIETPDKPLIGGNPEVWGGR